MSGSWTCSPQPQATHGSKPASGSLVVLMAMVTWREGSTPEPEAAAPSSPAPALEHAESASAPAMPEPVRNDRLVKARSFFAIKRPFSHVNRFFEYKELACR